MSVVDGFLNQHGLVSNGISFGIQTVIQTPLKRPQIFVRSINYDGIGMDNIRTALNGRFDQFFNSILSKPIIGVQQQKKISARQANSLIYGVVDAIIRL